MIAFLTKPFRQPKADEQRQRELEQAKRELLDHEAKREYYTGMCEVLKRRVNRLQHNN